MTSLGDSRSERYEFGEVLGTGTTATVRRAYDRVLDRDVALKEIHLDLGQGALLAEARAAARVSHPSIVVIHDVIDSPTGSFIAMELLEGPTLAEALEQRSFSARDVFQVLTAIASALEAAHAKRVVHCDIKPDNIFLTENGRTVVTDFGLANPELGGGTPGYMAPEQYEGAEMAPSMDVFGWGCVAIQMFSGTAPFGVGAEEAAYRTNHEPPVGDLQSTAEFLGLGELMLRCLEKDPGERPADGSVIVAALLEIAEQSSATVPTQRVASTYEYEPVERLPAEAALLPAIRLLVEPSDRDAWYFDVRAGEQIEVGREATLLLDDSQASRRHALLSFDGHQLLVSDLGSMNGTLCNGRVVTEYYAMPGDVLEIGTTAIHVMWPD